MDCRVIVPQRAINDLREIVKRIACDDRETAQRFGKRLLNTQKQNLSTPVANSAYAT